MRIPTKNSMVSPTTKRPTISPKKSPSVVPTTNPTAKSHKNPSEKSTQNPTKNPCQQKIQHKIRQNMYVGKCWKIWNFIFFWLFLIVLMVCHKSRNVFDPINLSKSVFLDRNENRNFLEISWKFFLISCKKKILFVSHHRPDEEGYHSQSFSYKHHHGMEVVKNWSKFLKVMKMVQKRREK